MLVGADVGSTYCYLLSLEEHRDGDTWGIRLLELQDRGFQPEATVGDAGSGLRAGQTLAMPDVPCRGDVFHALRTVLSLVTFLENRAYGAIGTHGGLERKIARTHRRGGRTQTLGRKRNAACQAEAQAVALAADVALLVDWLRGDLLAFAAQLDRDLAALAAEFQLPVSTLREVFNVAALDLEDPSRWPREIALRRQLGSRFFPLSEALGELARLTVRASSVIENLNSRLRGYFFLRRHLGPDYLALLQFFLNHRRFLRSERWERFGKSPTELLTGETHPHWLEMLGHARFSRN